MFYQGKEIKLGVGDWVVKMDQRNSKWFVDVAVPDDKIRPRYVEQLLNKSRAIKPHVLNRNFLHCLGSEIVRGCGKPVGANTYFGGYEQMTRMPDMPMLKQTWKF